MPTTLRRPRDAAGFTLIELLVAFVLLSLLAIAASNLVSTALPRIDRSSEPAVLEATARATWLVRTAGLAVLLFGAGFWYSVELRQPGRLETFRLGHFLLLALTYSLFFVVFGVLRSHETPAWLAVAIAAAVSYPLVVLHTATIVDFRFAFTAALPLAVATTGIVVVGVYGGALRPFVYLGLTCAIVAWLTCTHPRLSRGQQRFAAERERLLTERAGRLAAAADAARASIASTHELLAGPDRAESETMRAWTVRRRDALLAALGSYGAMVDELEAMSRTHARARRRLHRLAATQLADRLDVQLPQAQAALEQAAAALVEHRRARAAASPPPQGAEHCIACGHATSPAARYCPGCGKACAERRACHRCRAVLRLPLHLLDGEQLATTVATHCCACGERHAG